MPKNDQEVKTIFERLGLQIPESELRDVALAVKFLDEMTAEVRKLKSDTTEPAHIVSFPKAKEFWGQA